MLAAKRFRRRAAVFSALAGVSLVVSALGVGLNGYIATAETAAVRAEFAARAGADLALETSLALAADATEQDSQMRSLLSRELPASLTVTRIVTSKLPVENSGDPPLVLYSVSDLAQISTIADGAWPTSPDQVSVQADAASALGLEVGSPLRLGNHLVTVAATWRADDPLAGRWLGDQLVADGMDGTDFGPIVIDETLWSQLEASPRVRWAITANRVTIGPQDLDAIVTGWDALPQTIRAEDTIYDVTFGHRGRLGTVAGEILTRIESLRAVVPVALLTIGAIALLTIVELARLLATLRGSEYQLMWARGATARGLAAGVAGETALAAIPGAVVGMALASAALVTLLRDPQAAERTPAWTWGTPLVVSGAITVVVATTTAMAGRALESRDTAAKSTRPRRLVGIGALVLVGIAAALSTWQLLLYGTPITVTARGRAQTDPVAISAPALLLVSCVLLVLVLVAALSPSIQQRMGRGTGIVAALVARTMLRRIRLTVVPLVICALVAGQLVIAASYSATWNAAFTQSRELRTGSTLSLSGGRLTEQLIDQSARVRGVTGVAPITVLNTPIGVEQVSLVAAAPAAVRSLAANGSGLVDTASLADAIQSPPTGQQQTTGRLRFETRITGLEEPPALAALLTDDLGALHTVPLQTNTHGSVYVGTAEPGWTLIAIDVELPGRINSEDPPTFTVTGGTIDLDTAWSAFSLGGLNWELPRSGSGLGFTLLQGGATRIVAELPVGSVVPVAVSQLLAERTGLAVGDPLPIVIDSRQDAITATVSDIVPAIPGAERELAAMIDVATLQRAVLGLYDDHPTSTQAWVASATPQATADALRAELPALVGVSSLDNDQERAILGSAAVALWLGAVGASVLGLLALVAVVEAQLTSRRTEVWLLRALGLDAATTASARRAEFSVAAGLGLLTGLLAGAVVALLTVPTLARAAVPDVFLGVPTPATLGAPSLAIGLGAFILCLLVVITGYGAAVARQARRSTASEQEA